MKTYTCQYMPISGQLRTLDKLSLFELCALLERLQYARYVDQHSIKISTDERIIDKIDIPPTKF